MKRSHMTCDVNGNDTNVFRALRERPVRFDLSVIDLPEIEVVMATISGCNLAINSDTSYSKFISESSESDRSYSSSTLSSITIGPPIPREVCNVQTSTAFGQHDIAKNSKYLI